MNFSWNIKKKSAFFQLTKQLVAKHKLLKAEFSETLKTCLVIL